MYRLAGVVTLLTLAACASTSSTGPRDSSPSTVGGETPAACDLLRPEEIEQFVGEAVHDPRPSEVAPSVGDTTCLWADADPDDPGHLVTLTVTPKTEVGEPEPGADDTVYELSTLGDESFGAQQAGGGVRVVFAADGRWVDVVYEVLPPRFMPEGAIDDLIRLAEQVRTRLSDV